MFCKENIHNLQTRFKNIEKDAQEAAYRLWREEMAKKLVEIDREATAMVLSLKPTYTNKGLVRCRILSSAGNIEFRIHRLYDLDKKDTIYPFQYVLGKRHKVITELKEKAMTLAVNVPYERTSKLIEKLIGVKMGKMRIWEGVQKGGAAIRREIGQS